MNLHITARKISFLREELLLEKKMFKPLILIPFYNHFNAFKKMAEGLSKKSYPVLVVDDGSSADQALNLKKLCTKYQFIYLDNENNKGKGVAVKKGLLYAYKNGYTHALQIDADGQHNLDDIVHFFNLAEQYKKAIINGCPEFDMSIPKSRFYAKKITNFWVFVETFGVKGMDAMCGFRVYPIKEIQGILSLLKHYRMGFDIEILVKSYLNGISVCNQTTKVTYPIGGISHFRAFRDNLEISLTHAGLCLYALKCLIFRRKHGKSF